jgi:hypothetical protein
MASVNSVLCGLMVPPGSVNDLSLDAALLDCCEGTPMADVDEGMMGVMASTLVEVAWSVGVQVNTE